MYIVGNFLDFKTNADFYCNNFLNEFFRVGVFF